MIKLNLLETLPNEVWKFHKIGVAVSNLGRCYLPKSGTHSAHYTYGSKNNAGYLYVKGTEVHVLVAECFIPNPNNKPTVDHINRNKSDNRVENLRWFTRSEQQKNSNHPTNNIRSKQVAQINPKTNEIIRIWESTKECGRNNFNQGNVAACCRNEYTPNSPNIYKGFKWQYA